MIIFVGAHDNKLGMGLKGSLPWGLIQGDKEHVHHLANGKAIVVGERSYHNYRDIRKAFATEDVTVISKSVTELPDAKVVNSLEPILHRAKAEDLWVLGGGSIFKQLLPHANKMYITKIEGEFEADTFFPEYDSSEWEVISCEPHSADRQNPYPYTFLELQRKT